MTSFRLIAWLALGFVLATPHLQASNAAETQEIALKRVNLLVGDLDRSLAIYRDILGFRVFEISESSAQSYSYAVFGIPAAAKLRFATLDSSTETRALALTEVKGVDLPGPPSFGTSSPVIRITHFDEVLARLRADGHVVVLYRLD